MGVHGNLTALTTGLYEGIGILPAAEAIGQALGAKDVSDEIEQMRGVGAASNEGLYRAANIAGSIALMAAVGEATAPLAAGAGKIAGGVSKIAKAAPYVQKAASGALTFAATNAIQNVGNVSSGKTDVGNYLKNIGISAAQGTAGSIAGQLVGGGIAKYLTNKQMQTMFNEFIRQTASGMTTASVNQATGYILRGEKPSEKQIVDGLITAFAFSVLSSAIGTMRATQGQKNSLNRRMQQAQEHINALGQPAKSLQGAVDRATAAKDYVNDIREYAKGNYFAGQQEYVDAILEACDMIDVRIDDYIAGLQGTPESSPTNAYADVQGMTLALADGIEQAARNEQTMQAGQTVTQETEEQNAAQTQQDAAQMQQTFVQGEQTNEGQAQTVAPEGAQIENAETDLQTRVQTIKSDIINKIVENGGMSGEEVGRYMDSVKDATAEEKSRAFGELFDQGLLDHDGENYVLTEKGKQAVRTTEKAEAAAQEQTRWTEGHDLLTERVVLERISKNLPQTNAAEIGIKNGTQRPFRLIPQSEETVTLQKTRELVKSTYGMTDEQIRFVSGKIGVLSRNTGMEVIVEGARVRNEIYISADDLNRTMRLGLHEGYHWADRDGSLTIINWSRITDKIGEKAAENMLMQYVDAFQGCYDVTENMQEYKQEICADAAANINRINPKSGKGIGANRIGAPIQLTQNQRTRENADAFRRSDGGEEIIEDAAEAPQSVREEIGPSAEDKASAEDGVELSLAEDEKLTQKARRAAQEDSEYLALAAEPEKNKARLRQMLDAAAKAAGYKKRMFHETNAERIHVFRTDIGTNGATDSETPYGIFTKSTDKSIGLGSRQMELYVKADDTLTLTDRQAVREFPAFRDTLEKIKQLDEEYGKLAEEADEDEEDALDAWIDAHPDADLEQIMTTEKIASGEAFDIDDETYQTAHERYRAIMDEWTREYDRLAVASKEIITNYLRENGYDSMYLKIDGGSRNRQTDSLIVLDSNQVKSADLVTYDDDGNVIPLSERFNSEKDDSRYSVGAENAWDDDARGNGYDGWSMSNNARLAYENGEKPLSKWTKKEIIDAVAEINPKAAELIKGFNVKTLQNYLLYNSSWHHTSSMYNKTNFYAIDENLVEDLTQEDVKNWTPAKETKDEKTYRGDFSYIEWTGPKTRRKANNISLADVNITEKGSFYIVTDDEGNVLARKKIGSNGTIATDREEVDRRKSEAEKAKNRIRENSSEEAAAFYEKLKKEGYAVSGSGSIYAEGRKPSPYDYDMGLENFFDVGEKRLKPNQNGGYDLEIWNGSEFVKEPENGIVEPGEEDDMTLQAFRNALERGDTGSMEQLRQRAIDRGDEDALRSMMLMTAQKNGVQLSPGGEWEEDLQERGYWESVLNGENEAVNAAREKAEREAEEEERMEAIRAQDEYAEQVEKRRRTDYAKRMNAERNGTMEAPDEIDRDEIPVEVLAEIAEQPVRETDEAPETERVRDMLMDDAPEWLGKRVPLLEMDTADGALGEKLAPKKDAEAAVSQADRKQMREQAKEAEKEKRKRDSGRVPTIVRKSLHRNIQKAFSIPKSEMAEANRVVDAFAERIVKNGKLTAEERDELFDTLYATGIIEREAEEYLQDGRGVLVGRRVYVPEEIRQEAVDEYAELRRRAFAAGFYLTSDTTAMGIDEWQTNLTELAPDRISATSTDRLEILRDIIKLAEDGKMQQMSLPEYARTLAGFEYGSVDAFLDELEGKLDFALETFAKEAEIEYETLPRTEEGRKRFARLSLAERARQLQKESRDRAKRRETAQRQNEQRELRQMQEKTLKELQWLRKHQNDELDLKDRIKEIIQDIDLYAVSAANEMNWSDKWQASWKDLAAMYAKARTEDPNFFRNADLERIESRINDKKLEDMTPQDIQNLYDAAVALRKTMHDRHNLIAGAENELISIVFDEATNEIQNAAARQKRKKSKLAKTVDNYLNSEMLTKVNYLYRLAGWDTESTWAKMVKELENGERKAKRYEVDAKKLLEDFIKENEDWLAKAGGQGEKSVWYKIELPELVALEIGKEPEFGKTVTVY
ncbi:MAG: hypothetical protein KBS59_00850, partial [Clostridiales bacterium]|nr:hypothetical protein [Clostridiales bacterium]